MTSVTDCLFSRTILLTVILSSNKLLILSVMNTWLDTISRVTVVKYHHWKEESRPLFQSNSHICKKLLDLVWDNREDMVS